MRVRILLIISICMFSYGCSGGSEEDRKPVYKVTGTVKLGGAPISGASVTFVSREKQPVAYGRTNGSGAFELTTYDPDDGAAAGTYAVLVTKYLGKAANASNINAAHGTDPTKNYDSVSGHDAKATQTTDNVISAQYSDVATTPLSANVESGGENKFDFELK
ncbi:hypothetical protein Pan241w_03660 [Gimesia alba]|uniref:Carboxypeptidase regulatory-like domain-containing protein n=1 Tax=Gimesia alba TaxID=2527973 RepID=A0A517R8V0_9PLAN|nr:carboxypeptidase-like regulatory domain-containing protein [Gimesia alba]QDT40310.1 hypothetical protein Pan241w_03660 [Gimesia alba]